MAPTRREKPSKTSDMSLDEKVELATQFHRDNPEFSPSYAAKKFGVSITTFKARLAGRPSSKAKHAAQQRLSKAEEDAIVDFTLGLADLGHPVSIRRLRAQATDILHSRDPSAPPLGQNWHYEFFKRYPDIRVRWRRGLDRKRSRAANADSVQDWYRVLGETIKKFNIKESNLYNMDEKGVMLGHVKGSKVLVRRGEPAATVQDGSRQWITIIEYICADGSSGKPTYIFPVQRLESCYMDGDAWDANFARSHNGWTDNELGEEWIKIFDTETREKAGGEHRLLIWDGHGSHKTYETIKYAYEHKIVIGCLPSHSSNETQPLDVVNFSPLSAAWSAEVERESAFGVENLQLRDFARLYSAARPHGIRRDLNVKAFEATGIHPFDPGRITIHRTAPRRAADENRVPAQPSALINEVGSAAPPQDLSLTRIRNGLEMDVSDNPLAQELQAALQIAEEELVASATRERLTGLRLQEMEEVRSRRTDGQSRKIGGGRILTTQAALEDLAATDERKRIEAEEKEARRILRAQRKKEKAAADLEKMAKRDEKKKQREAKAAMLEAKRAEKAKQAAQKPTKKKLSSKQGKENVPVAGKKGNAALAPGKSTHGQALRRSTRLTTLN